MLSSTADVPTGREPWAVERTALDEILDVIQRSRPAWQMDGLCREHPEVTWFPERGEKAEPAKEICRRCLVVSECAAWALEQDVHLAGIWGGLSGRDRRKLHARPAAA